MLQENQYPEFLSVPEACAIVGIGRTKLYALLSEGLVQARKAGTRTLIEAQSLRAWTASLPAAKFGAPSIRKRAPDTVPMP
jgi:excisionase family DNA binding protein